MSNEKLIEKKLRERVKKLGGWAVKFWAVNLVGFPDRVVLMPGGRVSFVELKSEGKKPTPRQLLVLDQLSKLGFAVYVIDNEEKLQNYLNEISNAI